MSSPRANDPDLDDTTPTVRAGGDALDLQRTVAMTDGPRHQAQDLQATVPMTGAAALAATLPARAPDAETVATRPALGEAATQATVGSAATFSASQTGMGGTLSRTATRLGRTRQNTRLQANDQQLDQKLQLSRGSVLADMGTILSQSSGSGIPKGLTKLIEEQGTEGRYHINRPLAAGGMGAVLDIADNDFRRAAAMKVIHGRFANDPQALERFLAEAQVTAQLEHPNIVPIHDMGVMADGTLYFTMKMIEGMSLGDLVKLLRIHTGKLTEDDYLSEKLRKEGQKPAGSRKGEAAIRADFQEDRAKAADLAARYTTEEILHIFLKVLDGVGFAHAKGVIHRDIKPDNIMLGGHGEVLVVDWGIAKILGSADAQSDLVKQVVSIRDEDSLSATMAGSAMGTIFYMPPEQATGALDEIDARSDVYALGATLYELLSLERCLKATSLAEMIVAITDGGWIGLDTVAPHLDRDLVAIVHRAMARTREGRYASCEDFAADLRRHLAGQAVAARRRGVGELLAAWVAAHKLQLGMAAGGALLIAGAVAGTLTVLESQRRSEAAGLVAGVRQTLASTPAPEALRSARDHLATARRLDPRTPDLAVVAEALALAEKAVEDENTRTAALVRARVLAEEAAAAVATGQLIVADEKFTAALTIDPGNTTWDAARQAVRELRANDVKRLQKQTAETRRAEGDALLTRAKALESTAPAIPELIQQALDRFTASEAEGVAVPGTGEARVAAKELLAAHHLAVRTAQAQTKAQAAARAAESARAAGRFDEARSEIAIALSATPGDAALLSLRDAIVTQAEAATAARLAAEVAAQRRAAAAAESDARLATARQQLGVMLGFAKDAADAQAQADALAVRLADAPLARKTELFAARSRVNEARARLAEQWALCEASATQAAGVLDAHPEESVRRAAARALLADLYAGRLQDARAARSLPEIAAFTNLLSRVDDGRYAQALAFRVPVTVTGPNDAVAVPVTEGPDTRLTAQGQPVRLPAGTPVELSGGAWEIRWGQGHIATLLIDRQEPVTLALPTTAPPLPGLRWVPTTTGGFWLGETEITVEQYGEFLNAPAQIAAIRTALAAGLDESGKFVVPPPHAPTTIDQRSVKFYRPVAPGGDPAKTRLDVKGEGATPIVAITRDDAEAYCAWLSSTTTGLTVRLPRLAERLRAAQGGDPRRLYPWGTHFDGHFAASADAGWQTIPPVSAAGDVGPYGHRHLAGGVRELLGDRNDAQHPRAAGVHGCLVAGGSWADDAPRQFLSDAAESIEPAFRGEMIGFRILVEATP